MAVEGRPCFPLGIRAGPGIKTAIPYPIGAASITVAQAGGLTDLFIRELRRQLGAANRFFPARQQASRAIADMGLFVTVVFCEKIVKGCGAQQYRR